MNPIILPNHWTEAQAEAVADFFWSVYFQLLDALWAQYPTAMRPHTYLRDQPEESETEPEDAIDLITGLPMEPEDDIPW